jgi:hypothetical protein
MRIKLTRALLFRVLWLSSNLALQAAEFYVVQNGNDANSGTQDKPFASKELAQDAVRAWKKYMLRGTK